MDLSLKSIWKLQRVPNVAAAHWLALLLASYYPYFFGFALAIKNFGGAIPSLDMVLHLGIFKIAFCSWTQSSQEILGEAAHRTSCPWSEGCWSQEALPVLLSHSNYLMEKFPSRVLLASSLMDFSNVKVRLSKKALWGWLSSSFRCYLFICVIVWLLLSFSICCKTPCV